MLSPSLIYFLVFSFLPFEPSLVREFNSADPLVLAFGRRGQGILGLRRGLADSIESMPRVRDKL